MVSTRLHPNIGEWSRTGTKASPSLPMHNSLHATNRLFKTQRPVVHSKRYQVRITFEYPSVYRNPSEESAIPSPRRSFPHPTQQQQHLSASAVDQSPSSSSSSSPCTLDWTNTAKDLDLKSPLEIMDHALATFGPDIAIAFSGAEDVALIEYAHLTGRPYRVFSLDTGRLNPETYRLFDQVEKHYNIRIEYTFPEAQEVVELVRGKGLFSFYDDGHSECCRIRKVKPLRKQLTGLKAWVTGQRKDQSPGTRQDVPVVQVDPVFEGLAKGPGSLIKYNPLSNMTSAEVWNFLRVMAVPTNALHGCGYTSIGCEPCTRPVLPNQHEREGRWWWEDATAKECGLHSGNIMNSAAEQAAQEQPDLFTGSGSVETLTREELTALLEGSNDSNGDSSNNNNSGGIIRDRVTLVVLYAPWCRFCKAMEPSYEELANILANNGSPVRVAKFQADTEREFAAEKFGLKTFPTIVMLPKSGGRGKYIKYPSERRDTETLFMWMRAMTGGGGSFDESVQALGL